MNLEYLRHGKALCGKVFRRFVETFNFHNDFISNLKGDADLQVVGGKVNVDRTDERHPVIRCQGCGGGGGGGGSSASDTKNGCYDIKSFEDGTLVFERPYYMVGGKIYTGPDSITVETSCIVALKIEATGYGSADITSYGSFSELTADQRDYDYYVIPLYRLDLYHDEEDNASVSVDCDFRNIPSAAMGEAPI